MPSYVGWTNPIPDLNLTVGKRLDKKSNMHREPVKSPWKNIGRM